MYKNAAFFADEYSAKLQKKFFYRIKYCVIP